MTAWESLKRSVLSTAQVRCVDREAVDNYAMHSLVLMENAAIGCVRWLTGKFPSPQSITLLCGRGNNGGDGLAIARHLQNIGWDCRVFLWGPIERLSGDNMANYEILQQGSSVQLEVAESASEKSLQSIRSSQVVVDAMLGTGASGNPRTPLADWIEASGTSSAFRVAIDIPTGISAETGETWSPHFGADATLTFVSQKPAMSLPESRANFGEIVVLPIGIPDLLIDKFAKLAAEGTEA